ncbi:MAG: hypothetical protein AB1752_01560 [Candidatus Zixiibacteriota bacterium]
MKLGMTALVSAILLFVGCTDKGNGPGGDPEPTEYNLYYATLDERHYEDGSWEYVHYVYVFDGGDMSLLDSIPTVTPATYIEPSLDGRWLFVSRGHFGHEAAALDKIDAATGDLLWSRQTVKDRERLGGSRPYILKSGEMVHYQSFLLDTNDGHEVGEVPDSLAVLGDHASLPGGVEILVTVRDDPERRIRLYNIETGEVHGSWSPRIEGVLMDITSVTLHPDQRHVLAVGAYADARNAWFLFGDLEKESTLTYFFVGNADGEIAIDPKRNLAVITGPSDPFGYVSQFLHLVNLTTGLLLYTLTSEDGYITGQACVNPYTGKVLTGPSTNLGGGPLELFDPVTLAIDTVVWPPGDPLASDIAIAPRPQLQDSD